jgi:hypothetical protein
MQMNQKCLAKAMAIAAIAASGVLSSPAQAACFNHRPNECARIISQANVLRNCPYYAGNSRICTEAVQLALFWLSGGNLQSPTRNGAWLPYFGIDGGYGYQTYTAVMTFQRRAGLYADGYAGRDTNAKLSAWLVYHYDTGTTYR